MPSSPRLQRAHTTTSPISRRVLFHPREEVKRTNKLGRTSNLYDDDTGMLNSQLTDTQWAMNIGLEATQETNYFTCTPVKSEAVSLGVPSSPALPNRKSKIDNVKMEEPSGFKRYTALSPIKAEMFAVAIPPALPGVKKEELPSPLLYRLPGITTCDLPPIYHLPDSYLPDNNKVLAAVTAPRAVLDSQVPVNHTRVVSPHTSDPKPSVDLPVASTTPILTSESTLPVNDTPAASTAHVFPPDTSPPSAKLDMFTPDMETDTFTPDTKPPARIALPVDYAAVAPAAAIAFDCKPPAELAVVPSTAPTITSSPSTLCHIGQDAILDHEPPSEKEVVASTAHTIIDILHNLADELCERYRKDLTAVENERDLLRLQLAYQEKYINHLRYLMSDQGLSPPSSPVMESQKDYFHL
ncbi:hypothetical protein FB446DRAFT_794013 [Lentinula raphanica]|nr:hypothetical protein FB446DRAFT_794013 [Lentinula raphanica]